MHAKGRDSLSFFIYSDESDIHHLVKQIVTSAHIYEYLKGPSANLSVCCLVFAWGSSGVPDSVKSTNVSVLFDLICSDNNIAQGHRFPTVKGFSSVFKLLHTVNLDRKREVAVAQI